MYKDNINKYLAFSGFETFQPKSILFDMDGVLYDSMPNHAQAWVDAMVKFNIKMTRADAYAYEGMRGVETIQLLVRQQQGREIDEQKAQEMYDEKSRLFALMPIAPIMPGVKNVMAQIKRAGMQIGIVTGSGQKPLIDRLLSDFNEYVSPAHLVTAYDVTHGKPAAEPYLMGLQRTGNVAPNEAIVIENAPLGVQSGVAARIFTIAVNSGPLPNEALKNAGANIVFNNMNDLNEAWKEINS